MIVIYLLIGVLYTILDFDEKKVKKTFDTRVMVNSSEKTEYNIKCILFILSCLVKVLFFPIFLAVDTFFLFDKILYKIKIFRLKIKFKNTIKAMERMEQNLEARSSRKLNPFFKEIISKSKKVRKDLENN